jgi:phospholipid/cholesterol/gamma-HCH transport system substrate-binding protein
MKISNETKVGVLGVVAITLLILGFNFLKGRNLFSNSSHIFAKYTNVSGLGSSNAVMVNGLQIGTVYEIKPMHKNIDTILVTLNLTKKVDIPVNSVAVIKPSTLGLSTPEIDVTLGDSPRFLKLGDTIITAPSKDLIGGVLKTVDPVLDQLTLVFESLDTVLMKFSSILDPNTKNNLRGVIAGLNNDAAQLGAALTRVNGMLDKTSSLSQTLDNLNTFSANLAKNNDNLSATLSNLKKTSDGLAASDIKGTFQKLDSAANGLKSILASVNGQPGNEGTVQRLNAAIRSLNTLLDDLRVHPKRYINISVFGKKDKSTPLKGPLPEDGAGH